MLPPPVLVSTARSLWHGQWDLLMGGLAPADAKGRYRRPSAAFAASPSLPSDAGEPDGHVLIVGRSCPWAHRAWLTLTLLQLAESISVVVVEPDPAAGRWRFPVPFEGCDTLAALYRTSGAEAGTRATVPALYSRSQRRILVNESARLIELLNGWPGAAADLWPAEGRGAIEQWRNRLQTSVNDGVYRCGFARNQAAYDEAEQELFATLIRMEMVYAPLFGCSRRPLWQLPALTRWRARFFALPGVAATCFPEAWRHDYFGSLFPLHPSGIVPAAPDLAALVAGPALQT